MSRRNATLTWRAGKLLVQKSPNGKGALVYKGQTTEECTVAVGEEFLISQTTFEVREDRTLVADLPTPASEVALDSEELRLVSFSDDADERIGVLAALPGVIRKAPSDEDLEQQVVDVLLKGIPRAEAAAVVLLEKTENPSSPSIRIRRVKGRSQDSELGFQPSRRLIVDAIDRRRQSVLYLWQPGGLRPQQEYTPNMNFDWALCVPLPDDPSPGLALYVAGRVDSSLSTFSNAIQKDRLKPDVKFAGLVAEIFGSLKQVLHLQRREAKLAIFLPQPVRAAIAERGEEDVLAPREAEVSVLFCDLRGSCQIADEGRDDLPGLWDRISEALGIMTGGITDQGGVIGDFQGDAAMGFWGWPIANTDHVESAARAALVIRRKFAQEAKKGKALKDFQCGIGIATGAAMAGRLGTFDQAKVSVYGPKVNLAARLESLTKRFQVSILIDEETAAAINAKPQANAWVRCRRLAKIRPYGMQSPLTVSELLPPAVEPGAMPERDRLDYEAALKAFIAGDWETANDLLQRLPADGASAFLRSFIEQHQSTPPTGWDGVIVMQEK